MNELIEKSGHFALHSIDRSQKDLLGRFKGPDPAAKFDGLDWRDGVTGCPILSACIGVMECRVLRTLAPGNHTLFVGEVVSAALPVRLRRGEAAVERDESGAVGSALPRYQGHASVLGEIPYVDDLRILQVPLPRQGGGRVAVGR